MRPQNLPGALVSARPELGELDPRGAVAAWLVVQGVSCA